MTAPSSLHLGSCFMSRTMERTLKRDVRVCGCAVCVCVVAHHGTHPKERCACVRMRSVCVCEDVCESEGTVCAMGRSLTMIEYRDMDIYICVCVCVSRGRESEQSFTLHHGTHTKDHIIK